MPGDDWPQEIVTPTAPGAIVARPAGKDSDLLGKRLLIGRPGWGWRGDLRGGEVMVSDGRTVVPVLSEMDWYRAEHEQVEVFSRLFPIAEVWMEVVEREPSKGPPPRDAVSRLVSLDGPPRREPTPARDVPLIGGRRIVYVEGTVAHRDLRAVSEPYQSSEGDICVRVSSELTWYRWVWGGLPPDTLALPIYQLWAE